MYFLAIFSYSPGFVNGFLGILKTLQILFKFVIPALIPSLTERKKSFIFTSRTIGTSLKLPGIVGMSQHYVCCPKAYLRHNNRQDCICIQVQFRPFPLFFSVACYSSWLKSFVDFAAKSF